MKILKMVYRRKDYENHRDDILLKLQKRKEQQMENINAAYREIYEKWGFNDHMIKSLLDDYTVTEILSGCMKGKDFYPAHLICVSKDME